MAGEDFGFRMIVMRSSFTFNFVRHGRTHAPLHADIPLNAPIISRCYFARRGDSRMALVWGPFQNFWNRLIGHHYIKVILLNRRTPALRSDAGNHQ